MRRVGLGLDDPGDPLVFELGNPGDPETRRQINYTFEDVKYPCSRDPKSETKTMMTKREKDISVLKAMLNKIDRAYIPTPQDQDQIRALKDAILALELCGYHKDLDDE